LNVRPSRETLGRLALLVGSLAATLVVLEAGARVLRAHRPRLAFAYLQRDELLLHRHLPGSRERMRTDEYAIEMRINSRGLRGPERPYDPPPGTRRVLLVGDSFVEGLGVEEHETTAALLEEHWRTVGARVQVLNGGVADYCTAQAYLLYKLELARYRADVVALFIYMNDIGPNSTRYTWHGNELAPVRTRRPQPARGDTHSTDNSALFQKLKLGLDLPAA
jgi:hypothetical protein